MKSLTTLLTLLTFLLPLTHAMPPTNIDFDLSPDLLKRQSPNTTLPLSTSTSPTSTPVPTPSYLCAYGDFGFKSPAPNTTITQLDDGTYSGTSFEILFCSNQYFKTRSVGLTVGLSSVGRVDKGGMVLALDYRPSGDGKVAGAGFYGYLFNVTIYPISGSYISGKRTLSGFEVATGYYNAYNYNVDSLDLDFVVVKGEGADP
ncbi:hypothetical protein K402DRAFT_450359 [Aulographum hederae CBS 113979]|uniref:Uncharacterized protein n=1 Tax=Aulographum hederae CBS 113979 TaxID=1176131 RepID=A0A6G1HE18_9PEZI|nr:hypothetical protein K402DRAFT_450359 [Aulographum hederae CBS 113979]